MRVEAVLNDGKVRPDVARAEYEVSALTYWRKGLRQWVRVEITRHLVAGKSSSRH